MKKNGQNKPFKKIQKGGKTSTSIVNSRLPQQGGSTDTRGTQRAVDIPKISTT